MPRAAIHAAAPGLVLAQATGRWGNYFNQELYDRPGNLPWAVKIAHPVHCSSVTACAASPRLFVVRDKAGGRQAPGFSASSGEVYRWSVKTRLAGWPP